MVPQSWQVNCLVEVEVAGMAVLPVGDADSSQSTTQCLELPGVAPVAVEVTGRTLGVLARGLRDLAPSLGVILPATAVHAAVLAPVLHRAHASGRNPPVASHSSSQVTSSASSTALVS